MEHLEQLYIYIQLVPMVPGSLYIYSTRKTGTVMAYGHQTLCVNIALHIILFTSRYIKQFIYFTSLYSSFILSFSQSVIDVYEKESEGAYILVTCIRCFRSYRESIVTDLTYLSLAYMQTENTVRESVLRIKFVKGYSKRRQYGEKIVVLHEFFSNQMCSNGWIQFEDLLNKPDDYSVP